MKDVAFETPSRTAAENAANTLDSRYGKIGISAVAAAVRYQGPAKNPAYAPAPATWWERPDEAA